MRTLLTFILLLAVGISQAAEQRFVPYNPTTKHTLGGIVYTNGAFAGDGVGLTNVPMPSLVGTQLNLGAGATITRGPGEVLEFSTEIVGAHVGAGDQLTNINASALGSGTVPEARLPVNWTADLLLTNSLTIYPSATAVNQFRVFNTNGAVAIAVSSNRVGIGQTPGATRTLEVSGNTIIRGTAEISGATYAPSFADYAIGTTRATPFSGVWNFPAVNVTNTATASNFVATAGGLTLPVLGAAPAVSGNNAVLWISNSAAPTQWITTTNGTFAH